MRAPREGVIRRLVAGDREALATLFQGIAADPAARHFHPHPFTAPQAARIAGHQGRDVYLGLFEGDAIVGYGMLRGWDEGYAVPSLGLYLHPAARGRRLAQSLMLALHREAARQGAERIRLKVYADNVAAIRLYRRLGYVFTDEEAGQRVGYLALAPQAAASPPADTDSATNLQPGRSR